MKDELRHTVGKTKYLFSLARFEKRMLPVGSPWHSVLSVALTIDSLMS